MLNSDSSSKDELCILSRRIKERLGSNRITFLHIVVQNIIDFNFVKVFVEKDEANYQILENDLNSYPAILYAMRGLTTSGYGLPLVHRDKHYLKPVFDYIFEFNTIRTIDRIIDLYNEGLIDILKTGGNTFLCKRKYDNFYEIYDVWDALKIPKPVFEILTINQTILSLMNNSAHRYDQHWMQYLPNDVIDEYFLEQADRYINSFDEISFFKDESMFDSVTYKEIKEILIVIAMMCFRNINYAYVTANKYRSLNLIDLLPLNV